MLVEEMKSHEPRFEDELKLSCISNYDNINYFLKEKLLETQKRHQAKRDAWILREFKKKFNVWANSDFKSIPARWKAFDNMWEELKKLLGGEK